MPGSPGDDSRPCVGAFAFAGSGVWSTVISNDFGTNNLKWGDAYDLIVSDR